MLKNEQLLTFWDFLNKYKIEIPIIQRDYAQGRIENETIRLTFLDAILQCIKNKKAINLDFIYGNIAEDTFQPLDGQQRLTTLFLLYLYAYKKDHQNDITFNEIFKKFTYTTRISAEDFCNELAIQNIDIDINSDNISSTIKDANWYYLSWKNDPTIRAMLIMLDSIHSKFKEIPNLFKLLTENKLISFYYLILDDFGLSDDLYIKMNARGKILTPFENLKAEIQNKSKEHNWESDIQKLEDRFAYKIDGKWNDLMWDNYKSDDNSVDEAHMRLISTLVMINVALNTNIDSISKQTLIQKINNEYTYRGLINYIDNKTFDYINKVYDIYTNLQECSSNILKLKFKLWQHEPKTAFFDQIVFDCASSPENNSSYTCKVLFFAQSEYFIRNKNFNSDKFQDWMRVVRNIVSRGDIDCKKDNVKRTTLVRSPEAFISSINLINELAEGSADIYKFLCEHEMKSSYVKEQINEEKIKAHIIQKYPSKKQLLCELENIELLKGRILFALKCANYNSIDIESIHWNKLEQVKIVLEKYFNSKKEEVLSNKLRRALLTIGVDEQYSFYDYYKGRTQILNDAPNKRSLIRQFDEIEYLINNETYHKYFMKLVLLLTQKSFDDIFDDFNNIPQEQLNKIPNWQVQLVMYPEYLEEWDSHYISISDDKNICYLLPSKQPRDIGKCKKL